MLFSIKHMLELFHKNNINYCHWKSNEHLDESMCGDTDLDILVDYTQRTKIEEILNSCEIKRFRATPQMQYNAIEDYIAFDKEAAKIWHLHLHYRLTLGEKHLKSYTIPWGSQILENRVYDTEYNIYRSSLEDEYFLLLLRMALKLRWRDYLKRIDKNDYKELVWLKDRTYNNKVIATAKDLVNEECSKEYSVLLSNELYNYSNLYKLQRILRKEFKYYTSNNIVTSYVKRTYREIRWGLSGIARRMGLFPNIPKRRVSPTGGAVVAIIGCDGAGKSTTISYIKKEFGKKIDISSVYLGSGDGSSSIIRLPMKIIAKKLAGRGMGRSVSKKIKQDKEKNLSIKGRLYIAAKVIWATSLAIEKNKKLKKIIKARNNGVLVVIDRYPQVQVNGFNDGPLLQDYAGFSWILNKLAKWEKKIYHSASINPPDLTIKLVVEPEIAMQRKPEMSYDEISEKIKVVNKLKLAQSTVTIDTSNEKGITFSETMDAIWRVV